MPIAARGGETEEGCRDHGGWSKNRAWMFHHFSFPVGGSRSFVATLLRMTGAGLAPQDDRGWPGSSG